MPKYIYYGDGKQRNSATPTAHSTPEPYIPDPKLVEAVNLSIFLRRPLLLEGEPGCGKSRLAYAIAYELGLPLHTWEVKSSDHAQDGLYTFDALGRLYDAQSKSADAMQTEKYVSLGAIGKAFYNHDYPSVILIDEIDKADLDFPNDLLNVLDKPYRFVIKEINDEIKANPDMLPIVIITSNKEKGNLPAPFLRRCIYHYVAFPTDDQLRKIVNQHHPTTTPQANTLVNKAIAEFSHIRNHGNLARKPGTSELLDWITALTQFAKSEYDVAQSPDSDLAYRGLLLKLQSDWRNYRHQDR